MNLLLLHPSDFVEGAPDELGEGRVRIRGRRVEYVQAIHRARPGDELRVGAVGGLLGRGRVLALCDGQLELAVSLDRDPPPALPFNLVLALPRPLVLKRALIHATCLGVKRIALIHARRVEKSYWQSGALSGETLRQQLTLGLEQAGDTVLPTISMHRRFRPFVEDELGCLLTEAQGFVAHPDAARECPRSLSGPVTVVIGPEGGFIPYEIEKLEEAGLTSVRLGPRVLRVEAAIPYVVARLG
jgi:RsmE family RNA methyltransferase